LSKRENKYWKLQLGWKDGRHGQKRAWGGWLDGKGKTSSFDKYGTEDTFGGEKGKIKPKSY